MISFMWPSGFGIPPAVVTCAPSRIGGIVRIDPNHPYNSANMAGPERKLAIRAKAAEVFADKGFDRASIRDVAAAAEMSLAGLYYYYRGKDEILFDIQVTAFQTLLDRHAEALAGVTGAKAKLDAVISAHCAFFASHLHEMKVMSREAEQLHGEYGEERERGN